MTPDVTVVRGEPDDTELAALVAGLAAGGGRDLLEHDGRPEHREAAARRRWRDAAHRLSDALVPGPDAWRWSRLP